MIGTRPAPGVTVNGTTFVEAAVSAGPEPARGIGWVASVFDHRPGAFIGNSEGRTARPSSRSARTLTVLSGSGCSKRPPKDASSASSNATGP